jgi:hypothetical protein
VPASAAEPSRHEVLVPFGDNSWSAVATRWVAFGLHERGPGREENERGERAQTRGSGQEDRTAAPITTIQSTRDSLSFLTSVCTASTTRVASRRASWYVQEAASG